MGQQCGRFKRRQVPVVFHSWLGLMWGSLINLEYFLITRYPACCSLSAACSASSGRHRPRLPGHRWCRRYSCLLHLCEWWVATMGNTHMNLIWVHISSGRRSTATNTAYYEQTVNNSVQIAFQRRSLFYDNRMFAFLFFMNENEKYKKQSIVIFES